jgi:large subunit ribosomal protein L9
MLRIEAMKIVLKENIEDLGKRGDIVEVAAGYARNYLLPRKLAIRVTPANVKMIELEQKALKKKLTQEAISYQSVVDRINQATLSFKRKAGEKDVIFGSVSVTDIKEALDNLGFEIEKKRVLLEEPIKRLGNYTVPIKVFHEKQAELRIEVKKEGEEEKDTVSEERKEEQEAEGKKSVGEKKEGPPESEPVGKEAEQEAKERKPAGQEELGPEDEKTGLEEETEEKEEKKESE